MRVYSRAHWRVPASTSTTDSRLFELAAAYAVGIVKNHPFVDGNKRTAYLAADGFLTANGCVLNPPKGEVEEMMVGVAAGTVDQTDLASWIQQHADCPDR